MQHTSSRWRLILNGKSAGDDAVREAVQALRDAGVALDVRVTWEGGDAERYVAEAIADGVGTIIAGGGDGTLSEVATTLAELGRPNGLAAATAQWQQQIGDLDLDPGADDFTVRADAVLTRI